MTEEKPLKRQQAKAHFILTCQHCGGKFRANLTRLQLKQYIRDIDKEQKKIDKEYYRKQTEMRGKRENAKTS